MEEQNEELVDRGADIRRGIRAEFGGGQKRKSEIVDVGKFKVEIRELPFKVRQDKLAKAARVADTKKGKAFLAQHEMTASDLANVALVSACAFAPDTDERVWNKIGHAAEIMDLPSSVVQPLLRVAFRVNGIQVGEEVTETEDEDELDLYDVDPAELTVDDLGN
jgi:hypothetical protein